MSSKKVPLKISVLPTLSMRQFEVASNFHDAEGEWEDNYISFSGYFGKYSPHTFAVAPEMLAVLDVVSELDIDQRLLRRIDTVRAKARGGDRD